MHVANPCVFVVDDDRSTRESLSNLLRSAGLKVRTFASAQAFLTSPRLNAPSCLVLDVQLPGLSGLDLQQELARGHAPLPIIFITGHGDIPMTVRAMKAGAIDFLTKPFRDEDLLSAVAQALHHGPQMAANTHTPAQETPNVEDDRRSDRLVSEIVGHSAALRHVLQQVELVAPTEATVLLCGETGTGKELIARAIHTLSHRGAPRGRRPLRISDTGGRRQRMRSSRQITKEGSLAEPARPRQGRSGRMAQALGGLLALLSLSLIGGCQEAVTVAGTAEPPEVQVTPVVQQDVPIYSEWVGTTVGYVTAQIRARISGYLMSQHYTEGAFVKAGDLLFRIDPRPYQAAVDQDEANHALAQAQLEQSRAQLAQAQAQVEQAKAQVAQNMAAVTQAQANQRKTQLDVDKYTPLVQDGSVSRQEFDTAVQNNLANKAAVESARANVEAARANLLRMQANTKQAQADITRAQANVQAAKAALDNAHLNLGWTQVKSPIDGLAGLRNVDLGEVVTQDQTVLTTVSTLDPIYVDFQLSEEEYLRYTTAAAGAFRRVEDIPLELLLVDGTTFPHRGRFNTLDRDVSLTTGTFRVRSEFPNPEALLRPGQYAKVRAAASLQAGALLVPQRAVQDVQGQFQVGVVGPDNTVEIRPVKVGPRMGPLWVITEGLKPGERVIVAGLQNVRAGAVVKASPVEAEAAGAGGQPGAASAKDAPAPTGAASQRHPSH